MSLFLPVVVGRAQGLGQLRQLLLCQPKHLAPLLEPLTEGCRLFHHDSTPSFCQELDPHQSLCRVLESNTDVGYDVGHFATFISLLYRSEACNTESFAVYYWQLLLSA